MSKTIIDFNDYQYNIMLDLETNINNVYNNLQKLGEQALGVDKFNIVELLKSSEPGLYIVNEYAELYLQDFPKHLSPSHLFIQQTKVSLEAFRQLKLQLEEYMSKMGNHKPTINAKGIKSNLKKEKFNIYLNENKKDYYNLLENLIKLIAEIKQYNGVSNSIQLVRAYPDLIMDGTELKINKAKFK